MTAPGYRIEAWQKACKFGKHWMEDLAGDGGSKCPMFDCTYDGEKPTMEICDETNKCPAYEPEETLICKKHDIEYSQGDWCDLYFQEER